MRWNSSKPNNFGQAKWLLLSFVIILTSGQFSESVSTYILVYFTEMFYMYYLLSIIQTTALS